MNNYHIRIFRSTRKMSQIYFVFGAMFLLIGIIGMGICGFSWSVAIIWFLVSLGLVFFFGWLSTPPREMELNGEQLIFRIGRSKKEILFSIYDVANFVSGKSTGFSPNRIVRSNSFFSTLYFNDGSEFTFNVNEYENYEEMRNALYHLLKEKKIVDFSRFERIAKQRLKYRA